MSTSAAERLAANMNLGVLSRATDLKKRLWFLLGALIVYRLGTYIPVPGIDPHAMAALVSKQQGGILGVLNMFSGGALSRMTIFALAVMPYISASIILSILTVAVPQLAALKKEGAAGYRKINQYTRYGTVLLAAFQGYGIANGLEARGIAINPGPFFLFTTTVTLTGGTLFLMWIGEQITARGIGNGISMIIFTGIIANLPNAIGRTLELGRTGVISTPFIFIIIAIVLALIAFIVFMERAQRRIIVQYPKRQQGNKMFGGESTHMPLKLNTSGVIPPIFASSILLFPLTIAGFSAGSGRGVLGVISTYLAHGQPLYIVCYVLLIIFFSFFYTSIVFNPAEKADDLKKGGGFIAGIRPGQQTAEYLDFVLTRLTAIGAFYVALVCAMPELFVAKYSVPFQLGGTGLMIVVNVTIDFVTQVQSHLFAHQYEGLIKKAKLKGKLK
jgi:preprotein translocase subunit SecY